ncbi:polar amino acid transport system substrate-binding protein [Endobacter medicaginis]|uniref:Polar amino acid transport system substrate-binding protein n=1 Tax=Endobacter medicaginis TaxID=1181271 RepID=A0A839UVG6_9PROT|nr:ABC transporter substrate-binding protein/permease [Endobacter medicaginis]MBB3173797.1 polar amino acid transport system substrate-binding protein [Endobacter medicaginis]MCX5475566.1 ABC transporter substrate-binding protein/permease [Endobacter medicaginis]
MRRLLAALLLLASGLQAARAGEPVAQPTLRWAGDARSGAPYEFHDPSDPSRLIGYEVEIAEEVARRLHRRPEFVQNEFDGLIPGLQAGQYDIAMDGLEITPEHEGAVAFSTPYYTTWEQLVVRRSDPRDSLAALAHGRVGTLRGTTANRILEAFAAEHPGFDIRLYDEEFDAYTDLRHGRLDGVLLDAPIARYYAGVDPALALVGPPVAPISYGIALRKTDTALRNRIDEALAAMRDDGTLARILARWNLLPEGQSVPGVAPVMWQHWVATTAPVSGWRARLHRYAQFLPMILRGAWMTLLVSVLGMAVAVVVGLPLALLRRYAVAPFAALATAFIELVRGTPLLVQILFIFYGLPELGIQLNPLAAGVIALGLNYAAYEAENYRAGLEAVPRGQAEAAAALGLSPMQGLRYVVVPQALRTVLPVMTNDFISLLKDSSLVSVITLTELSQTYEQLSTTYFDYLGPGAMVAAAYLLLGLPFVRLARFAERRLARQSGIVSARH